MATSSFYKTSEEASFCDPCHVIKHIVTEAKYSCVDCGHELCETCLEYHKQTLSTRNHTVIELQDGKKSDFQVSGRRSDGVENTQAETTRSTSRSDKVPVIQTKNTAGNRILGPLRKWFRMSPSSASSTQQSRSDGVTDNLKPGSDQVSVRQTEETEEDLNRDLTSYVQCMSLSPSSCTQPSTFNTGQVYQTFTLKKGLNVSLNSDDGPCVINGIVMVQDKIIVTDRDNSKLKVFDSHYRFQFEYKCDNKPNDIDMLDNTTIVVSSLSDRNMKVLSLGNTSMTELTEIDTEYECHGVCCHNGKIYCVVREKIGSEWVSQVRVYTPDGKLRRRFEYLSDGKVDCNDLNYITINPQTGILYITDWYKGVVAMSTSGDVIAVMSPPQLKNPQGIAVDDHGHIYVCGVNSNNVIQMSADGNNVEILSNNPRCYRAQCVKIYGNTLLLARRGSDVFFTYELSSRSEKAVTQIQNTVVVRTQKIQGVLPSLSSGTQLSTSNTGQVYKTLTLKKGLNVSLNSDDGPCDIRGIVMVQDKIIVTDEANSKLKVFDSHYRFQFEYKCDNKPYDIDMLDNTTIVVSLFDRNMKVLSLGNTSMTELTEIDTEYECHGVCCHNEKIYCVVREKIGSEWVSQVRVYTPDGKLRRRFEYLSDGKVDCNDLNYITINPQTGILYITDWYKGVVAMSTSGDVIAVMSPPQLKNPQGIAVDDHGHIYVCGVNSNNVIQMSADGNNAVEILANNPRCRYAQCVKIYGNTLLLARRGSDTVFIYELS